MNSIKLSAAALIIAGSASADFVDASFTVEEIVEGYDTYKIYVQFNNPADQLFAIDGTETYEALSYNGAELYNTKFAGFFIDDVGTYAGFPGMEGDSYLTIGGQASDTTFAPGLFEDNLDADGSVVQGTSFSQPTNGGYFDINPTTAATDDGSGNGILIAQLTVASEAEFRFTGTVSYQSAATGSLAYGGFVVPAPGALALLGLAGLGRRRRG